MPCPYNLSHYFFKLVLLMVKYYQNLKAGQGRHEALRSAQLELLNSPDSQHPKYWAAFFLSGNWTILSDK